jgi:hypothetical protein
LKLLVDVSRLEAEGKVTAEQAAEIRRIAAAETTSLAINLLFALGVAAVVAGIFALRPSVLVMAATGAVVAAAGLALHRYRAATFGLLGSALVLIGVLVHCGAVLAEDRNSTLSLAYVTIVLIGMGVLARQSFLAALSVFTVAALLGNATGYWRASYWIAVTKPTITIVAFALLAAAAFALARRVGAAYRKLPRVFALLSIVCLNFGFWVGSLWGDYLPWSDYPTRAQAAAAQATMIPRDAFSIVWAGALLGLGVWAARRNQRVVVNAVAVFGAIHFYTQWFERMRASPEMIIASGVIAVAIAYVLWRYNRTAPAAA